MTKRLGPFLSKPTSSSMSFWMYIEDGLNVEISVDGILEKLTLSPLVKEGQLYPVFQGTFTDLKPNTKYQYQVTVDQRKHLPSGAIDQDLKFTTLPENDSEINFITMSCHGIKEYEEHRVDSDPSAWNCWDKLYLEIQENPINFLVLGGDQVYMDSYFDDQINSLNKNKITEYRNIIKSCYLDYWGHPSYQKILCQVPSFLMWDDHDILDGYGSRPDSFKIMKDNFKDNWTLLGDLQKEAFYYFQGSRNPSDNLKNLENNFSFDFNHPSFSLLALDLRSERNVKKKEMIGEDNKKKIQAASSQLRGKRVFIVSPVTIARISGPIEGGLSQLSNAIWRTTSFLGHDRKLRKTVAAIIFFLVSYISFSIYEEKLGAFWGALYIFFAATFLLGLSFVPKLRYLTDTARKVSLTALWGLIILSCGYLVYLLICRELYNNLLGLNYAEYICSFIKEKKWFLITAIVIPFFSSIKTLPTPSNKYVAKIFKCFKTVNTKVYGLLSLFLFAFFIWDMHLAKFSYPIDIILLTPLYLISLLFLLNMILESFGVIDELAGLDDDLKDGWSSRENEKELVWLKDQIILNSLLTRNTFILSGDIHTGGLTNLFFKDKLVPQITSSPISYMPMPAIGEKLTSGSKPIYIPNKANPLCRAENVFYVSERNFVRVSLLANHVEIKYFFENHTEPLVISYVD